MKTSDFLLQVQHSAKNNFENELYSDVVEIFPSHKTNVGKPISAWLGLDDKNGVHDPVMTKLSPAPESIVELNMCKCTTGCLTQRCKCKKNGFVCSELCHCKSFKNIEGNLYPEDFVANC